MARIASPEKIAQAADASTITVAARKWRDSNGNTYHKVRVYLNGVLIATSGVEYGYGSQYRATAADLLREAGVVPDARHPGLYQAAERAGYVFVDEDEGYVRRKKDL